MAAVTSVCTIKYVAELLNEDLKMLEAIIENDDNLSYGAIISVYNGDGETIIGLTDDGIKELSDARQSQKDWISFVEYFIEAPDVIARVNRHSPSGMLADVKVT